MLQILYFTIAGIVLYFFSDWILTRLEMARSVPFANRSLIFFAIILVFATLVFGLIQYLTSN